jgi:hypothetical protein
MRAHPPAPAGTSINPPEQLQEFPMHPRFFMVLSVFAASQPCFAQPTTAQLSPRIPSLAARWASPVRCTTPNPVPNERGVFSPNTWPGGIVYYRFVPRVTPAQRQKMLSAWATLSSVANVQFVERTNQHNYIEIGYSDTPGVSFSSHIGMLGSKQSIAMDPFFFDFPGVIMHETMHALGMWHEQQRADRDQHIEVLFDVVDPQYREQFDIVNATADGPYDFASLMHYQFHAFSPVHERTIRVLAPHEREWQQHIGQFIHREAAPSNGDVWTLTRLYGGSPPPRAFSLLAPARGACISAPLRPAFSWQAAEAATSYRLEVADSPLFTNPIIDLQTTQTSLAPTARLERDRLYFWRVTASNAAGLTSCFPGSIFTFYTGAAYPATLFVDDSAPAGGDGTSWNRALRDLSTATETAYASAGAVTEIRVARGTYWPAFGSADRRFSFWLASGCTLRGGYAGYGAAFPSAWDPDAHPTILSGDLDGDDLPGFVNNAENSQHVVSMLFANGSTLLEGFTLSGGAARPDFEPDFPGQGGGAFIDASSPVIRRCRFVGNYADDVGAAIGTNNAASNPLVQSCTFSGNAVLGPTPISVFTGGGGAFFCHNSPVTFFDCTFTGNRAVAGGAGFCLAGRPTLVNCLLADNTALATGGFVGGGALFGFAGSAPTLINCTVVGNTAPAGGAITSSDFGAATVANSILWGNTPVQLSGAASVSYSNVQGGFTGVGNLNQTPLFVNAPSGDYGLSAGSPGLDSGSNLLVPAGVILDLGANTRFADDPAANLGVSGGAGGTAIVDMGAYERQGGRTGTSVPCLANCDNSVAAPILNIADFTCFLQKYAAGEAYANCDQSSTAPVLNVADFTCFLQCYAAGCP